MSSSTSLSSHNRRNIPSFVLFFVFAFAILSSLLFLPLTTTYAESEILYESNFAEVPNGELPEGFLAPTGGWSVHNGRLIGISPSSVNTQVVFGDENWTDYVIEATMTFLSANSATRWASTMYRGPAEGGTPFYMFTIRRDAAASNGIELAHRTADEKWVVHIRQPWKANVEIGRPYKVRVAVYGESVMYFIDDEPILHAEHVIQKPNGTAGFVVNGMQIAIDDVVVRTLSEEDIDAFPQLEPGVIPPVSDPSDYTKPLNVAHRGASGTAPENTIAAFRLALEFGADLLELDVHRTRDDELVVIHDATVDRTAMGNYTGRVDSLTLEQIKTLDAGVHKGLTWTGEKVPTLEEALLSTEGRGLFFVEGKVNGIEKDIVDVIQKTRMEHNVVYQSFNSESVKNFRKLLPHVPAALLFRDPNIEDDVIRGATVVAEAQKADAAIVAINYKAVTPDFVRYVKARGLSVWVWTVNNPNDMVRMIEAGVDAILTNYPETLNRLLSE